MKTLGYADHRHISFVNVIKPSKSFLTGLIFVLLISTTLFADSGRGRHAQLYVVPAHADVVIDGQLEDWDLSGQIETFVIEATRSTQSAKIATMYDDEAFYISGQIADPTPMMNKHDPNVNPKNAWNADAVQFRLVTNPTVKYPVTDESTFKYKGDDAPKDTRDDIIHMLLWHYTDDGNAYLQIEKGMSYRQADPEWNPDGLVPQDLFQGAYQKMADGSGYTFEYRIPWATMGATSAPKGGDATAGTVNVLWSRPDGLATGGGSAWAYDVLGEPGFPYQNASTWGRLIFSTEGNVSKELVTQGLPPERMLPLEFQYNLPADTHTTIQLFDQNNQAVRILVPQEERPGGRNTERWDGLDDNGNLIPPGTYVWRGITSGPIKADYRFSVHNSGNPPHPTDNNKGGWGSDHSTPRTVTALKDGMLLAWGTAEYGWGIIRTDLNGLRLWGSKRNADHIVTDGKKIFFAGGHGAPAESVLMMDLADARPSRFGNGTASLGPIDGGEGNQNELTGLAYGNNTVYVSYAARNLVALFSSQDGSLNATWDVPSPERLAVRPDGSLAVVSDGEILSVSNGKVSPWIQSHLDVPIAIVVAKDGTTYVSNQGDLGNVSVFDPDGTFLRSVGIKGGRPAVGAYNPEGMYKPEGIALDTKGRLWVAENSDFPKRMSVWDTDNGKNLKEFFGGSEYFAHGAIDPAKPNEFVGQNMLWNIDWAKDSVSPISTIWRKTEPDMAPPPLVDAYTGNLRLFSAETGFHYAFSGAGKRRGKMIYLREGDIFRPVAGVINPWQDPYPSLDEYKAELDSQWNAGDIQDHLRTKDYLWIDLNEDSRVHVDEITPLTGFKRQPRIGWLDSNLTLYFLSGEVLSPREITAHGEPRYVLEDIQKAKPSGRYMMADADESMYTLTLNRKGPSLIKWSPDGEMLWNYPDLINWQKALNKPIVKAGRLWGMTQPMGIAGDFIAFQTYMGPNQIFRTDGQYIGTILADGRLGKQGAYEGQPEGQGGTFTQVKIDGEYRTFAIHGGQDIRVWEVLGLDTVKDLPGGEYEHTPELAAKARLAYEEYQAGLAGVETLVIAKGKGALETATPAGRIIEGGRSFEVRTAYDDENLYVRYEVKSPHGLENNFSDPQTIFRGGNLLDIQIATNSKADPERSTPAPGDIRILATRLKGKPFAVLYRPKVEGFAGRPIVLESPTGKEAFDSIEVMETVDLDYKKTKGAFTAMLTIPLTSIGLELNSGDQVRMDLGYIFGNKSGTRTVIRSYLKNRSFSANVVDDIPNESRLEPAEWGVGEAE